jgi:ribosomal protein S18 acetylase RimI-like enzyme
MTTIRPALPADAPLVALLFDAYRQFYGKPAEPEIALRFVSERLANGDSAIFLALGDDGEALGFTQLYPSFSSVSAGRIYVLNDLFVVPQGRGRGIGRALLDAAAAFGREQGALRLSLSTARTNISAQALYASHGWVRDESYYDYSLKL